MADQSPKPLQFFVKLLNGTSITLTFSSPSAYGAQIKQRIFEKTQIPPNLQRLITGGHQISDESPISQSDSTVTLLLSLRGGKGGFGSLLRGAATKAGQKKTNNFDACRDMSGRRLRHVNAEKRLEEWKEGEEERKMEKLAHEFLKKQAKKVKRGDGNGATQKYVNKFREDSDMCMEAVELALKESFRNGKRKGNKIVAESQNSKRLKIWKGKRAVEGSDSDDSSSDEEGEGSVVLNSGSVVVSEKDSDGSSGSVMGGGRASEASCSSGSEEDKDIVPTVNEEKKMDDSPVGDAEHDAMCQTEKESRDTEKNVVEVACETVIASVAVKNQGSDSEVKLEGVAVEPESIEAAVCCKPLEPLNFDDYNSATDMEVLGMERLKTELQSRGLKCGGTLQERAARLLLLKCTPLDKLPKKLVAKK